MRSSMGCTVLAILVLGSQPLAALTQDCPRCKPPRDQGVRVWGNQPGCRMEGRWSFGDPVTGNRAEFLAFARSLSYLGLGEGGVDGYLTIAQRDATGKVMTGRDGEVKAAHAHGVVEPVADAPGNSEADLGYVPGREPPACAGRIIARVTIDGRVSSNPRVQRDAIQVRQAWAQIDAVLASRQKEQTDTLFRLMQISDSLGGYKNRVLHCHDGDPAATPPGNQNGTCERNEQHIHKYLPEGVSYLWVDRLQRNAGGEYNGRVVIVPLRPEQQPRAVQLIFCKHDQFSDNPTNRCHHYALDPTTGQRAAWFPVPDDEHVWTSCEAQGCCRVSDNPWFE